MCYVLLCAVQQNLNEVYIMHKKGISCLVAGKMKAMPEGYKVKLFIV
jgi:hypothetical protein